MRPDRPGAHDRRVDATRRPGDDPRQRRVAAPRRLGAAHQHQGGGPVTMPEALPAVTVPSLAKAGRSLASASMVVPCFGCSSSATTVSPRRPLTVTGAISSLKRPAFCAASALFCEATAKRSCSSRLMPALGHVLGRVAHVIAVEGVP